MEFIITKTYVVSLGLHLYLFDTHLLLHSRFKTSTTGKKLCIIYSMRKLFFGWHFWNAYLWFRTSVKSISRMKPKKRVIFISEFIVLIVAIKHNRTECVLRLIFTSIYFWWFDSTCVANIACRNTLPVQR